MRSQLLLLCVFGILNINAQDNLNIEFVSNVQVGENGNDIWGYVDGNGTEYAIMGSRANTWIWSLEDPAKPIERAKIPGDATTWRDIKSWDDHLYVTCDSGDDGLLVIDMSMAPDSIRFQYLTPGIEVDTTITQLGRCHNLYIDENGFCYLAGCRISGANKAIVLDLNQDKWTPPIVGVHGGNNREYAHDLYVKNDMLYASEINKGELAIYDATDKTNLIKLGSAGTSFSFTHNAWTSTDQNYIFTTDERANAYVDAFDISDPTNIVKLDRYRPLETEGRDVIPHNTHYLDGFLVTSWYTDGVVVIDGSNPSNLIKVGAFDTFLGSDGGFSGCWGAYPYLPSGLLLASDINSGLYVLSPTYNRAGFLEGIVTNSDTGNEVNGVDVSITASQLNEGMTNALGSYKTGLEEEGTFMVTFSHPDYEIKTEMVDLKSGEITNLDVALTPLKKVTFKGSVFDASNGSVIPNAVIVFKNDKREIKLTTDENGNFESTEVEDNYNVTIGSWGHLTKVFNVTSGGSSNDLTFELEQGYADGFELDLGWQQFSTAVTGGWVREIPIGTFATGVPIAPGDDVPEDLGDKCYVTGNGGGSVGFDDVDEGEVVLVSPTFNVSDMVSPTLNYKYWFVNTSGEGPIDDTLDVRVCDINECVTVARYVGAQNEWSELQEISLTEMVDITQDLRVEFVTSDYKTPESSGHLVEAAIDVVSITDNDPVSSTGSTLDNEIAIYPNPFENKINLEQMGQNRYVSYEIYDALGKIIQMGDLNDNLSLIDLNVTSGIYTLKLNGIERQVLIKKIVKK